MSTEWGRSLGEVGGRPRGGSSGTMAFRCYFSAYGVKPEDDGGVGSFPQNLDRVAQGEAAALDHFRVYAKFDVAVELA